MPDETAVQTEPGDRKCRVCGCTETTPCLDRGGMPCSWVAGDLCSACLPIEAWKKVMPADVVMCALALGDTLTQWAEVRGAPLSADLEKLVASFFALGFQAGVGLYAPEEGADERIDLDQPIAGATVQILLPGKDF
jgi:hypothetical protein